MDNMDESESLMISIDQSHSPSIDGGSSYHVLFSGTVGQDVLKKGPWTPAEDAILVDHVKKHGEGNWNSVQKYSGLSRCGKSCRLRWTNHLRPNLKKGAFTAAEEQMIIELHAKLGNKWARMAAHLPGRTDNEIKNYWNTRIKRHQRAGLPLYPSNLCQDILNDNQLYQGTDDTGIGDKQHNQLLHANSCGLSEAVFGNFKSNQRMLSCEPSFPNSYATKMLHQFLGSRGCGNPVNPFKWLNETRTLLPTFNGGLAYGLPTFGQCAETNFFKDHQSFGLYFPNNSDPGHKSLSAFGGTMLSSYALNDNFSSSQPLSASVKLELPSFQYSEMDSSRWIICPASPREDDNANLNTLTIAESAQLELVSTVNNDLLEALLYEAQATRITKNQEFANRSNASIDTGHLNGNAAPNSCHTEWETCNPVSADASIFSNTPPTSSVFLPESLFNSTFGLGAKPEAAEKISNFIVDKDVPPSHLDFSRPDALLDSNWFIWDPIGNPGEELDDFILKKSGSSVSPNHSQDLYSYPLKDMPPVY